MSYRKLAWVPFVVANRRNGYSRNRAGGAIIAALIFFLVLGLFFFVFFNRFIGFTMIPIWTIISGLGGFLIFIAIIGAIASSISTPPNKVNQEPIKPYQYQPQEPTQKINPYKIQIQPEEPIYQEVKQDIPILSDINYCRFCGTKTDRDAKFCHQCGIKL